MQQPSKSTKQPLIERRNMLADQTLLRALHS